MWDLVSAGTGSRGLLCLLFQSNTTQLIFYKRFIYKNVALRKSQPETAAFVPMILLSCHISSTAALVCRFHRTSVCQAGDWAAGAGRAGHLALSSSFDCTSVTSGFGLLVRLGYITGSRALHSPLAKRRFVESEDILTGPPSFKGLLVEVRGRVGSGVGGGRHAARCGSSQR